MVQGRYRKERRNEETTVKYMAKHLSDNYVMHIIGFGDEENIKLLRQQIESLNKSLNRKAVTYDGYYSGKDLDNYLFGCHIGLSSNVMRPNFANNSFPSKVITYMCHDLSIVLGYAEAFYDVPMAEGWTFYHEYTTEKIADAIMSARVVPEGYYHARIQKMNEALQQFLRQQQKATDEN